MLTTSFNFCNWNVRGLGDQRKCEDVLTELISIKPDAIFLQETKLADITSTKAKSFLPKSTPSFTFKPANGTAGGILNAVSNSRFQVKSSSIDQYSLTSSIRILSNNNEFKTTNVYAPTDHALKQNFLDHLDHIAPQNDIPWLLLGDFNLMRHSSEKNTDGFHQHEADAFNDKINSLSLIELPLLDRRFTWTSNRNDPTLERLDRVFINLAWAQMFPNTSLSSITRFISDHVPLIVHVSTTIPRPATFRFENSWAVIPSARPMIQQAWASAHGNSNGATLLVRDLKKCRTYIKSWRRSLIPTLTRENNARLVISFVDHLEESRTLNTLELALRKTVIVALHRTLREKLAHWRQRGKIRATIDGDDNSKYFHVCASNRYRNNKIALLSHQGTDYTNHEQKIDILTSFFKTLLGTSSPNNWNFQLSNIYPEEIPQLRHLDDPFTHQ
jgi:exonuclease III